MMTARHYFPIFEIISAGLAPRQVELFSTAERGCFRTGDVSFARLNHVRIDRLKADRSVLADCACNAGKTVSARALGNPSHALGMNAVADEIAIAEQHASLATHHCDTTQGRFFGRPARLQEARRGLPPQNHERQKAG